MNRDWKKLINNLEELPQKSIVDNKTYRPTKNELNNICYLSMKYIAHWQMRQCDLMMITTLGGEPQTVDQIDDNYIPQLANYIWDHIMGEPSSPNIENITKAIKLIKKHIYSMDEKTRNLI